MRTTTVGLGNHFNQETTTLCTLWKVTRVDGLIFGFTDASKNLTYLGITYNAATGHVPSNIATNSSLSVDNLEVEAILDSSTITEEDIAAGLWDYAEVEIMVVNYLDLSLGHLGQRKGWLGNIRTGRTSFIAELRGMTQKLQQQIGELYTPSCRATFGDTRCKVNKAAYTFPGTVNYVYNNRTFAATDIIQADGYFEYGIVTWTSGLNIGLSMEVKTYTVGNIVLQLPMPYNIGIADTFNIVAGCGKRIIEDCKTKFNNVVNFRGEPYFPGVDKIYKGPQR